MSQGLTQLASFDRSSLTLQKLASFRIRMPQSRRYLLISLCALLVIGLAWVYLRSTAPVVPEAIKRGYSEATLQARAGHPGVARVLCTSNWAALIYRPSGASGCTPNCQLPREFGGGPELADADLQHESPEVRIAAIKSTRAGAQRPAQLIARAVAR